jgi:hypothetical protein
MLNIFLFILIDKSTPSTINEQQKTKSHTMPRSRSLLEKKSLFLHSLSLSLPLPSSLFICLDDENVAPSSPEQSREVSYFSLFLIQF